jgi:hypothetical protein
MNIKLLTITAISASAVLFSACSGSASVNTNTAKPANAAPANTTTPNTNAAAPANTNAAAPANSTATAPATSGSVIKIEEGGIMMTVPKGFDFSKDGEDTIVTTEDKGVDIRFTVPKDGDYEKAVKDAAKEIDEYIKDVKFEQNGEKGTVDGMEITSSNGTGKDEDGKTVMFDLTIIKTLKKPVLAITYAEKPSMDKHATELEAFFKSIKKM